MSFFIASTSDFIASTSDWSKAISAKHCSRVGSRGQQPRRCALQARRSQHLRRPLGAVAHGRPIRLCHRLERLRVHRRNVGMVRRRGADAEELLLPVGSADALSSKGGQAQQAAAVARQRRDVAELLYPFPDAYTSVTVSGITSCVFSSAPSLISSTPSAKFLSVEMMYVSVASTRRARGTVYAVHVLADPQQAARHH